MSDRVINIHEAKTHLSRLVEQVATGEELIIGKAGKPMAGMIPYSLSRKSRKPGALAGQIVESAGCWDSDENLLGDGDDSLLEQTSHVAENEAGNDGNN